MTNTQEKEMTNHPQDREEWKDALTREALEDFYMVFMATFGKEVKLTWNEPKAMLDHIRELVDRTIASAEARVKSETKDDVKRAVDATQGLLNHLEDLLLSLDEEEKECVCEKPDPCFGSHPSCTDMPNTPQEKRCRDCFICGKDIPVGRFKRLLDKERG